MAVVDLGDVDGAAEGEAEDVVAVGRDVSAEEVVGVAVGVEVVVAEVLVGAAVDGVGAGLGDDVDLAGGVAAELGAVLSAEGLELGDGVGAGIGVEREVGAAVEVVRAVNGPVVGGGAAAVDGEGDGAGSAVDAGRAAGEVVGSAAEDDAGLRFIRVS